MKAVAVVLVAFAAIAHADPDADFQTHVRDHAAHTNRELVAWGTLQLDGTSRPYRFAMLEEAGGVQEPNLGAYHCGDRSCRGEYVIEQAPDKIWLVTFDEDRSSDTHPLWRVTGWHRDDDGWDSDVVNASDAWTVLPDRALRFKAMHNHGQLDVFLGLRGGRLVVLELSDVNREDTNAVYARRGGACTRACSALASFERPRLRRSRTWTDVQAVVDMFMAPMVSGPAPWDRLREPAVPPESP